MKRTLSLLLVLVMVIAMIPNVFAATDDKTDVEFDDLAVGLEGNPQLAEIGEEYTTAWGVHYYKITPAEAGKLQLTVNGGTVTVNGEALPADLTFDVEAGTEYIVAVTGEGATWSVAYVADEKTNNADDPEKHELKDIATSLSDTTEYDVHYYEVTCKQLNRWELVTTGDVVVKQGDTVVADTKDGKLWFDAENGKVYTVIVTGKGTTWTLEVSPLRMSGITLLMESMIQIRCTFKYDTEIPADAKRGMLVFDSLEAAKSLDMTNADDVEVELKGTSYYGYTAGIPAMEMIDNKFIVGYIEYSDGTYDYSYVKEYGVKEYTQKQVTTAANPQQLKDLCNAIVQYGAAAQVYKTYKPDTLLNDDTSFTSVPYDSSVFPADIASWQVYDKGDVNGFTLKAITLLLEGAIEYRIKYALTSAVTGTPCVEYQLGEETGTGEMVDNEDGTYYAYIRTIRPENMDEKVIFKPYFESNGEKVYGPSMQYSALVYLYNNLIKNPTSDANLKSLLEALSTYINKVDVYFKYQRGEV